MVIHFAWLARVTLGILLAADGSRIPQDARERTLKRRPLVRQTATLRCSRECRAIRGALI
jgi:hypothetical protein